MRTTTGRLGRITVTALVSALAPAAVTTAPAMAQPLKCKSKDIRVADRVQAGGNRSGVVFDNSAGGHARYESFQIFDNYAWDFRTISVEWNYAGVRDAWKLVGSPPNGGSETFRVRMREGRSVCFRIVRSGISQSDTVRHRT